MIYFPEQRQNATYKEKNMRKQIESIQILRGLAALSVVFYHYHFYLLPSQTASHLFGWGAIGVDLFFVISGFVMFYVTDGEEPGIKTSIDFLAKRLIRIIPIYYIILAIAFLTNGAMSTFHYPAKIENLLSALTFSVYDPHQAPFYIDGNGLYNVRWTLNYELYFYFAFAFSILFKNKLTILTAWFIAPVVAAYYITSTFSLHTSGYQFNTAIGAFLTNPIILEFGMGVIAGYFYKKMQHSINPSNPYPPCFAAIGIALGIYFQIITAYSILSGATFSILVLTFALYNNAIIKTRVGFLILLGNISFSLYLIHNPFASFLSKKVDNIAPNLMHSAPGFVIMVVTSIITAYASNCFLEKKLTNFLNSKYNKKSRDFLACNKNEVR